VNAKFALSAQQLARSMSQAQGMAWWAWTLLVVWGPTTLLGVLLIVGFGAVRAIDRINRTRPTEREDRNASWLSTSASSTLRTR
jgi:hypothetical protein